MDKEEIYKKAWNKWGIDAQVLMLIEEMGELTTQLCHYMRGRCRAEDIAEEIADVLIMLEQHMQELNILDKVADWIEVKLKKLEAKLND